MRACVALESPESHVIKVVDRRACLAVVVDRCSLQATPSGSHSRFRLNPDAFLTTTKNSARRRGWQSDGAGWTGGCRVGWPRLELGVFPWLEVDF